MDAIQLLIRQHRDLEDRLQRLIDTSDPHERADMCAEVGDLLTLHVAAEEEIFYPAVNAQRTEDVLLESLEEHLALKRVLADLLTLSPDDETFEPKLKVLAEQSEHHHEEEEHHLFPKVSTVLNVQQLDRLGDEMAALQQRLRRQGNARYAVSGQTAEAAPLI